MANWTVFAFLTVKAFMLRTAPAYHAALEYADRQGDCGGFITYMMERIDEALTELLLAQRPVLSAAERVPLFLEEKRLPTFTRKDYRRMYPELSTATTSRDLAQAVRGGLIAIAGTGRVARYRPVG